MSEPFLSEIRIFGFNFAPRGWAKCDGQILPIAQNQSLYSLLGTTYGGDGRTSFALPDLRGRVPLHTGNGINLGAKLGEETHQLTTSEMPDHAHVCEVSTTDANAPQANNGVLGKANNLYRQPTNLTPLSSQTLANTGGSQGHQNMQPFIVLNFCIALTGLFPSRN
ncbi:MAG: tail fiber protein [Phycisphaerae bacterium]|jgi:microcystin-dependent protein